MLLSVPESLAGVRLQDFLQSAFAGVDHAALRRLVQAGSVRVNRMEPEGDPRLFPYDQVEVRANDGDLPRHKKAKSAPKPTLSLEVLFESATCLVVHKPAGLVVVPDRTGEEDSVHAHLPGLRAGEDLRIVHRLDRDTSGCLALAKGLEAAQHFDEAFRGRTVHKHYVALAQGLLLRDEQVVDHAIGEDAQRPGRMRASRRSKPGFKAARTIVRVRERFLHHTLVDLEPETGRSHQLRVHLQAIGHPIAGDLDYGGEPLLLSRWKRRYKLRTGVAERPLLARMFLHAERLEFADLDGTAVHVTAPLPNDLQKALRRVSEFSAGRDERR